MLVAVFAIWQVGLAVIYCGNGIPISICLTHRVNSAKIFWKSDDNAYICDASGWLRLPREWNIFQCRL